MSSRDVFKSYNCRITQINSLERIRLSRASYDKKHEWQHNSLEWFRLSKATDREPFGWTNSLMIWTVTNTLI